MIRIFGVLMLCGLAGTVGAGPAGPDKVSGADGVGGVRFFNIYEHLDQREVPPGGFFFDFRHGPNSTLAIYKTAAGKGRELPIRLNRHNEETGVVIKGSVLFKAGYDGEFERVLREGDSIIIPTCVPHGGIFGWDANEETILLTTFAEKYVEYGPDNVREIASEFANKIDYKPDASIAETPECAARQDTPVTWTLEDVRAHKPRSNSKP